MRRGRDAGPIVVDCGLLVRSVEASALHQMGPHVSGILPKFTSPGEPKPSSASIQCWCVLLDDSRADYLPTLQLGRGRAKGARMLLPASVSSMSLRTRRLLRPPRQWGV